MSSRISAITASTCAGVAGCRIVSPEQADVELAAIGEIPIGLVVLGAHAASAGVEPRRDPERVEIGHELAGVGEPGVLGLQRHPGRDEGDAAGAAGPAPVGLPAASFSILPPCGSGVPASILAATSATLLR